MSTEEHKEKVRAYGVGTFITSPYRPGMVLAIRELKDKPPIRKAGEWGIPLETEVDNGAARSEAPMDIVRASLAEVISPQDVPEVGGAFQLVSMSGLYLPSQEYPGVHVRHALVRFTGDPDYPFSPNDEVADPQWVPIGELTAKDGIRPLAKEAVVYQASHGGLTNLPEGGKQLFTPEFSLEQFHTERARYPDRIFTL